MPKALLILAGPTIASMLGRTAMSFVDFIMVSQLGTEAQAAMMPAGIVLFCLAALGSGTLSVVSTLVSQSFGRGQHKAGSAYAWQGVYLGGILGIAVLPGWWLAGPLFALAGHEPGVQAMEVVYVQFGLMHIGPAMMALALSNFFVGIHKPMVGLWAALLANAFNIGANYVLIFGHLGFEPRGIAGAAQATAMASALQAVVLVICFLSRPIHRMWHSRSSWRYCSKQLLAILKIGLPAGLQFMTDIIAFAIFTLFMIGHFGTAQLAANNITFKFLELSFMPAVGLGIAVTASVGKAIGQGKPQLARTIVRWAIGFAVGYMGLIGGCYVLFGRQLAMMLSKDNDPLVIDWAVKMLLICAIFQVFDAMGIIYSHALRGAGDTRWPAVMMFALASVLFMGGGFLACYLVPHWGSLGPWTAGTVYLMALGSMLWLRWRSGPWEGIRLM